MKDGSGPAAVTGDERADDATAARNERREGGLSRKIREPEDLPADMMTATLSGPRQEPPMLVRDKTGESQTDVSWFGIFLF